METVKKGYWIVSIDVSDAEGFARYREANKAALDKYGARFLARAGRHEVKEGVVHSRNTIVEFDSYEKALACYESPEYQAALAHRIDAAKSTLVIVEGA